MPLYLRLVDRYITVMTVIWPLDDSRGSSLLALQRSYIGAPLLPGVYLSSCSICSMLVVVCVVEVWDIGATAWLKRAQGVS